MLETPIVPTVQFQRTCCGLRVSRAVLRLPFPAVEAALSIAARELAAAPHSFSGHPAVFTEAQAHLAPNAAVELKLVLEVRGVRTPSSRGAGAAAPSSVFSPPPSSAQASDGLATLVAALRAPHCTLTIEAGVPHFTVPRLHIEGVQLLRQQGVYDAAPPPGAAADDWRPFIEGLGLPEYIGDHFRHQLTCFSGISIIERVRHSRGVQRGGGGVAAAASHARLSARLDALDPWSARGRLVARRGEATAAEERRVGARGAQQQAQQGGRGQAEPGPFSPRRRLLADAGGSAEERRPLQPSGAAHGVHVSGDEGYSSDAGWDVEAPPPPFATVFSTVLEVEYAAWPPWSNPTAVQVTLLLSVLLLGVPLLVLGGVALMASLFHWRF